MLRRGVRLADFQDISALPPSLLIAARPDADLLLVDEDDTRLVDDEEVLLAEDNDALLADNDALLADNDALLADNDALLADDGDSDLLSLDATDADPLSDPLSQPAPTGAKQTANGARGRFDPKTMLPAGGWYRDDLRMTIAYRGTGHSDPVLRSAVEMLSQLPPSDPVRKRLLATRAVAACVSCHPAAARETAMWKSWPLVGRRDNFTKFAHGPHLHIAQLADCSHCHQVQSSGTQPGPTITLTRGGGGSPDHADEFTPMTRQACASCHTAKAAGDNCTKCHRYHIVF